MGGSDVRLDYVRWVYGALYKLDPALAERGFGAMKMIADAGKVSCVLSFDNRPELDSTALEYVYQMGFLTLLTGPFEEHFGCNKFWNTFKKVNMQFYLAHREEIKRYLLDLPLVNFQLRACHYQAGGRVMLSFEGGDLTSSNWSDAVVTVRTMGITAPLRDQSFDIRIDSYIAVGREIYHKDLGDGSGRAIRAVDYRTRGPMSSLVVLGPTETVTDFVRHASVMQKEYKRLTSQEHEILSLLGEMKSAESIVSASMFGADEVVKAIRRLRTLRYIDEYNQITADGLRSIHTPA